MNRRSQLTGARMVQLDPTPYDYEREIELDFWDPERAFRAYAKRQDQDKKIEKERDQ